MCCVGSATFHPLRIGYPNHHLIKGLIGSFIKKDVAQLMKTKYAQWRQDKKSADFITLTFLKVSDKNVLHQSTLKLHVWICPIFILLDYSCKTVSKSVKPEKSTSLGQYCKSYTNGAK